MSRVLTSVILCQVEVGSARGGAHHAVQVRQQAVERLQPVRVVEHVAVRQQQHVALRPVVGRGHASL
jgi:hypothetical protein